MLKKFLALPIAMLLVSDSVAQSAAGTDIFVADMAKKKDKWVLSNHRNITDREGYDNQPYFLKDGNRLLYTSAQTEGKTSQTDAFLYDINAAARTNLSRSSASEYSPTPWKNETAYSMIRVGDDGKQKLWAYSFDGQQQLELLKDVEPVGYHAWVNDSEVMMFVLGEPHRLEFADIKTGKSVAYDQDIGASLFKIPGTNLMSYSRNLKQGEDAPPLWQLTQIDPASKRKQGLIQLPEGAYYYAWTPDQHVIAAKGSTLQYWRYSTSSSQSSVWTDFANVSAQCPKGVTRLAVNPQQSRIAYVCDR